MLLRRYVDLNELSERGRAQFRWDCLAGLSRGFLAQHVSYVFAILVANEVFQCSSNEKTLIIASIFIGMGLSPLYESLSCRYQLTRNLQGALPGLSYAAGACIAALGTTSEAFLLGCLLMGSSQSLALSAKVDLWRNNYPPTIRGRISSISLWLTSAMAIISSALGGWWLDISIEQYRSLFLFLAIMGLLYAYSIYRMPKTPSPVLEPSEKKRSFHSLREDSIVAYILLAWFFAGTAMHLLLVQKTEYLSSVAEALQLSKFEIAVLASSLSEATKLLAIPFFAALFDKVNFLTLRIIVCIIFLGFISLFFRGTSFGLIALGSLLHGIGQGGGHVLWNLWVTKFSKKEETGSLMAVHLFLTGLRGAIAPWIGYHLLLFLTFQELSNVSVALMGISIVIFVALRFSERGRNIIST